jgi:hypothetical protein
MDERTIALSSTIIIFIRNSIQFLKEGGNRGQHSIRGRGEHLYNGKMKKWKMGKWRMVKNRAN